MEDSMEDYKLHANALKDEGNEAFQSGDLPRAINLFSQAIDLDPDNHVFYSNRAAAYMKSDSKSKALHDAEKCVELAPSWSKGYSRLGAAQQSLKRFEAAMDTFKKGIELDPNNKALWSSLKVCQESYEADKKEKFRVGKLEREAEEARLQRREDIKRDLEDDKARKGDNQISSKLDTTGNLEESSSNKVGNGAGSSSSSSSSVGSASGGVLEGPQNTAAEDDMMADFFAAVAPPPPIEESTAPIPRGLGKGSASSISNETSSSAAAPEAGEATSTKDESILTEKYTNQDLGTAREQFERLTSNHWEWRNLNPYNVLLLGADATEEDIKLRFKKLSLKVHPDRLRDVENARDAFEQVKEAYSKLCDETQKKNILMHIATATSTFKKDRKKLIHRGKKEDELPDYEEELNKAIMKHFAEIERMRRHSEKTLRAHNAREKMQDAAEQEQLEKLKEFDKNWTEDGRRDKRVGNWREFQLDPTAKKAKASSYKEEIRENTKHGAVQVETWKKNWK